MKSINSALVAIRRSPYQSLLAIFVIMITFFVAYAFSFLSIGTDRTLSFFETQPQVIAFMKLEADGTESDRLAEQMRQEYYVKDVKVVSKKDALKIYQDENQDNPLLLELVTEDILPASVEVSANNAADLQKAKSFLEKNPSVDEVTFQEDVVSNLIRWTQALRYLGLFILLILLSVSFLMIVVTISMKISSKRGQIKIMKFVGASDSYISSPYLWEAIISSSLANVFAFAFYYASILYISPWLEEFLSGIVGFPISWRFFAYQFTAGLAVSILLAFFATMVAVKRMLKK